MAGICIFCEKEGDLSKEHLWPDWLSKMYVRKGDEKHTFGSQTYMDRAMVNDGIYDRPGHLFSLKNRVVCRGCNNGWMSEVEEEAKPIIIRMLSGQKHKITHPDLKTLSFWVAMKIVTAEFAVKKDSSSVTPLRERLEMREKRKIPSFFNIFLGVHSTGHNSAWLRHSCTLSFSPNGPTPPLEGRQRNAQSISFIVGPVFIYVLNVRLLGFVPEEKFNFGSIKKIWPSKMHFLKWPQKPLKRVETDVLSYMLLDLTESESTEHISEMPDSQDV